MRAAAFVAVSVGLAAGCMLPNPDYDGTSFTCTEPPYSCPSGYYCHLGACEREDQIRPDAGASVDAAPPAVPDAGDPQSSTPDAGPPPMTTTLTFGERPGDDVSGVTTDTWIQADAPSDNFGAETDLTVDSDPVQHGLIRFDLAKIPAGSKIDSAVIEINVSNPIESGELVLYRLLEDWEENEATWTNRRKGQRWTAPGAAPPMSALPIAQATLVARDTGIFTVALPPALVRGWVDQPSSNFGLLWMSTSPDGRGAVFDSSESTNTALRPQLTVTFH